MSKLNKLNSSMRKRIGYCQKYGLSTSSDLTIMKLEKALRQERRKKIASLKIPKQMSLFEIS